MGLQEKKTLFPLLLNKCGILALRLGVRSDKEANKMTREEVRAQIAQTLGAVPGRLEGLPDPQLEHQWGLIAWLLSDSVLTAREKALVAFGAAAVAHCPY